MSNSLQRDGVTLRYIVEGTGPFLVLTGAPLGIQGFEALASKLVADFTVVRHDPRGVGESVLPHGAPLSLAVLADDLRAIVEALSQEPVLIFGASGGAAVGLHLVLEFPEIVQLLVAHEPPLFGLAPNGEMLLAEADKAFRLALDDPGAAFQAFAGLSQVFQETRSADSKRERIILPPLSAEESEKQRFALGRMAPCTVHFQPSIPSILRERIIVAAGEASIGQPARMATEMLAEKFGVALRDAPGNHLGMMMHAERFASWLRQTLQHKRQA